MHAFDQAFRFNLAVTGFLKCCNTRCDSFTARERFALCLSAGGSPAAGIFLLLAQKKGTKEKGNFKTKKNCHAQRA
ncbi:MAG: hypothetical protein ABIP04_09155 [Sulfuriferula sp.]